jgi:hypothetical protein
MTDNRPILDQLLDLLNVSTYGEIVPAVRALMNDYDAFVISSFKHLAEVDEFIKEMRELCTKP